MKKSGSYFEYTQEVTDENNKELKTNEPVCKISTDGSQLVTDVLVTDDDITKRTVELGVAIGELINKTKISVNMEGNETHVAEVLSFYMSLLVHPVFAIVKPGSKNFPLIPALLWEKMEASILEFTTLDKDWIKKARLNLSQDFSMLSEQAEPSMH